MSFLNPKTNRSGVLAGIYLVNAVVAPLTIFYSVGLLVYYYLFYSLTFSLVDGCQLRWCNQACLCRRHRQRILLPWKHHWSPDLPGPRRP